MHPLNHLHPHPLPSPQGWIDQPQGPILVYFKETQTPEGEWEVGPGQSANSAEALAKGAVRGQVRGSEWVY